tara:strand:+ start:4915 stop:5799 length:885 start_codon:yes stop_codon:yes gene_type:complete
MEAAGADGAAGGAAGGTPAAGGQEGVKPTEAPSPNVGWEKNSQLDANGNPTEKPQPKKEETPEPSTPTGDADKGDKAPKKEEGAKPREYDLSAPVVKQVEKLLTDAGLDVSEVAQTVINNDGKVSPELIKALVDTHGEAVASIVAEQLSGFHESRKTLDTKRDQVIFDQVADSFKGITEQGGKETWSELAGWAKENVPNDERKEINKLLAQGGIATKYAVDDLVNRFKNSESFTQSADLMEGDATVNDFGVKPLSKSEYVMKLRELEAKGHVYGQSQEMASLDKRRTSGRQRGV